MGNVNEITIKLQLGVKLRQSFCLSGTFSYDGEGKSAS